MGRGLQLAMDGGIRLEQREIDGNSRAISGGGIDIQGAAEAEKALPHPGEAKAGFGGGGVKTCAVIAYHDANFVMAAADLHDKFAGAPMLEGVVEKFLHSAEKKCCALAREGHVGTT